DVTAIPFPVANAGTDQFHDDYVGITLDGTQSSQGSFYAYEWTTGSQTAFIDSPTTITTTASVDSTNLETNFNLRVYTTNNASCEVNDSVKITIIVKVIPANAFSPQG